MEPERISREIPVVQSSLKDLSLLAKDVGKLPGRQTADRLARAYEILDAKVQAIVKLDRILLDINVNHTREEVYERLTIFLSDLKEDFGQKCYFSDRSPDKNGNEIECVDGFVSALKVTIAGILNRNVRLQEFRLRYSSEPSVLAEFLDCLLVDERGVTKIVLSPFSAHIFLEPEAYEAAVNTRSLGVHIGGTIFNFIKDAGEHTDFSTVWHEELHGLLHEVEFISCKNPASVLDNCFNKFEDLEIGYPVEDLDKENLVRQCVRDTGVEVLEDDLSNTQVESAIMQITPEWIVDSIHEEFLTELDNLRREGFQKKLANGDSSKNVLKIYATASSHIREVQRTLDNISKYFEMMEDEYQSDSLLRIKAHLQSMPERVARKFKSVVLNLKKAFFIADQFGEDAVSEVRAACLLLKPSQFRHLINYVKRKSANLESADTLDLIFDIYSVEDLNLEAMTLICSNSNSLSDSVLKRVADAVSRASIATEFTYSLFSIFSMQLNPSHISIEERGIASIEDFRSYRRAQEGLLQLLSDRKIPCKSDRVFDFNLENFFTQKVSQYGSEEIEEIVSFSKSLNSGELLVFNDFMRNWAVDSFFAEFAEAGERVIENQALGLFNENYRSIVLKKLSISLSDKSVRQACHRYFMGA